MMRTLIVLVITAGLVASFVWLVRASEFIAAPGL